MKHRYVEGGIEGKWCNRSHQALRADISFATTIHSSRTLRIDVLLRILFLRMLSLSLHLASIGYHSGLFISMSLPGTIYVTKEIP